MYIHMKKQKCGYFLPVKLTVCLRWSDGYLWSQIYIYGRNTLLVWPNFRFNPRFVGVYLLRLGFGPFCCQTNQNAHQMNEYSILKHIFKYVKRWELFDIWCMLIWSCHCNERNKIYLVGHGYGKLESFALVMK